MTLAESQPLPSPRPYRRFAIFLLVGGALLVLSSLCALLSYLVTPFMAPESGLTSNAAVLSVGAVGAVFGACLLWIGISFRRGESSPAFRLPTPWIFLGAYIVALVLGQLVLFLGVGAAYFFPPFHVFASLLVSLLVLAFAARRLELASLRSMLAQFSWGGLVTITLALVFEILVGGGLVALGVLGVMLIQGAERTMDLISELQNSGGDVNQVLALLSAEPMVLVIAATGALLMFVVIVPVLEEVLKSGGPAILISRRQRAHSTPSKSEVVLWGLAAGAGYSFTENMFNAQGAISGADGASNLWATTMLLRSGTSLMHMVATATVAVGWYAWFVERKRSRFFLLLALSTLAHATWNTGALVLGSVAIISGLNDNLAVLSVCIVVLALAFLIALFIAFLYWLVRLIRWGRRPPVEIITSSGTLLEIKG